MAPLSAGLVIATLWGLHRRRSGVAGVAATLGLALKFTLGLPFLMLLILHRRYKMMASAIGGFLVLNMLGFARLGGWSAVTAYRAGIANLERVYPNSPDPWQSNLPRVDWTYMFTGLLRSVTLARGLAYVLAAVCVLVLVIACRRVPRPVSLESSCQMLLASSCIGLLVYYHHHYDLYVLVAPLLLLFLLRSNGLEVISPTWPLVPLLILMAVMPEAASARIATSLIGARGSVLVKMSYSVALTIAFVPLLAACAHFASDFRRHAEGAGTGRRQSDVVTVGERADTGSEHMAGEPDTFA